MIPLWSGLLLHMFNYKNRPQLEKLKVILSTHFQLYISIQGLYYSSSALVTVKNKSLFKYCNK